MAHTILVVDDEETVRSFLHRVLSTRGFRVLAASSAASACALFDHDLGVDLLLTDVRMPEMDGPELARRLLAKRPSLPVIFISGHACLEELGGARAQVRFVAKPFQTSQLLESISQLLSSSEQP